VRKLADCIQQMRQPIRAVETLLSWVDVNQFDQSASTIGESSVACSCCISFQALCVVCWNCSGAKLQKNLM